MITRSLLVYFQTGIIRVLSISSVIHKFRPFDLFLIQLIDISCRPPLFHNISITHDSKVSFGVFSYKHNKSSSYKLLIHHHHHTHTHVTTVTLDSLSWEDQESDASTYTLSPRRSELHCLLSHLASRSLITQRPWLNSFTAFLSR